MAKAKILIVDDSKAMVDALVELLASKGYVVVTVATGSDALSAAQREKPDLILLDIAIPGLDGFMVGGKLKQDETTKDIPIIMLTAHAGHEEQLRAVEEAGAADFVAKPFRVDVLMEKIEGVLGGRPPGVSN